MKIGENSMTYKLLVLLLAIAFSSCTNNNSDKKAGFENNSLTQSEIKDGWKLLFDGKSFEGWRGIGIDKVPDGHWKIEDGCIKKIASGNVPTLSDGQPQKGGDLITKQTFNNFELSFEWKISHAGNSGVKYNVIEELSIEKGISSALGYEFQVLDNINHSDTVANHLTGSLYDIIGAPKEAVKRVGEFNTSRIVFNNNHGEHWLNGVKVVEYYIDTPEFQKLFEKSKYKDIPNFAEHKVARIVLQDHGNDCWYRNIKIRTL